jgi:hypothetical protein
MVPPCDPAHGTHRTGERLNMSAQESGSPLLEKEIPDGQAILRVYNSSMVRTPRPSGWPTPILPTSVARNTPAHFIGEVYRDHTTVVVRLTQNFLSDSLRVGMMLADHWHPAAYQPSSASFQGNFKSW